MNRKLTTRELTNLLIKQLNPNHDPRIYTASEVTFDYSESHPIRVDYMLFRPANNTVGGIEQGVFYCYEIKSCVQDFKSGHGLNFLGDYNYLVLPDKDTFDELKSSIPFNVGVYIPTEGFGSLICIKKAKKIIRTRSVSEMLLMMFRSSNRELIKKQKLIERLSIDE